MNGNKKCYHKLSLVESGADLALQNDDGNTPLHVVVEESARKPAMTETFLEVASSGICRAHATTS